MADPASQFERYERIGTDLIFESVSEGAVQPFDGRLARARFLSLMDQAAAAALREGRDTDDIECERWVEISESRDGPWRLELIETLSQRCDSGSTGCLFMRGVRLHGTIAMGGES